MAPDSAWLATLQDGDKVIVLQRQGMRKEIHVLRLTATQIITTSLLDASEWHFERTTGRYRQPANELYRVTLLPYTEEAALQIDTSRGVEAVRAQLGKVSQEKIEGLTPDDCATLHTALAHMQQLLEGL